MTGTTATLYSLVSGTAYNFAVRAICGPNPVPPIKVTNSTSVTVAGNTVI